MRSWALVGVTTPAPALVRSALQQTGGAMPKVVFDVDKVDQQGRQLEWSYSIGGMYRPFQVPAPGGLVIEDKAFAWQGKYDIALKSRVVGDYRTTSEPIKTPVIVDSVGPRFVTHKAEWDGDIYNIAIWDIVSGNIVQWALGTPGAKVPATTWHDG